MFNGYIMMLFFSPGSLSTLSLGHCFRSADLRCILFIKTANTLLLLMQKLHWYSKHLLDATLISYCTSLVWMHITFLGASCNQRENKVIYSLQNFKIDRKLYSQTLVRPAPHSCTYSYRLASKYTYICFLLIWQNILADLFLYTVF